MSVHAVIVCASKFVSVWIYASLHIVHVRVCVCGCVGVCLREEEGKRVHESQQTGREESLGERNHHRKLRNIISVEDTEALTEASAKLDKPFNPFIKNACSSAAWAGATRMKH